MISKALKEQHVGTAPKLSRLLIVALQRVGVSVGRIEETLHEGKTVEFKFYRWYNGDLVLRLTPHDVVFDGDDTVLWEALKPYLKADPSPSPRQTTAASTGTGAE